MDMDMGKDKDADSRLWTVWTGEANTKGKRRGEGGS